MIRLCQTLFVLLHLENEYSWQNWRSSANPKTYVTLQGAGLSIVAYACLNNCDQTNSRHFLASNIYVCLLIASGGLKILSRCLASNVTSSSQPLGLYIFFHNMSNKDCPNNLIALRFQNQVWPVQSRLKRCDVSPADEQVYNKMNMIQFLQANMMQKKAKKWMRKSIDQLDQIKLWFITWPSGGEPQRWTTWRWQQGERI